MYLPRSITLASPAGGCWATAEPDPAAAEPGVGVGAGLSSAFFLQPAASTSTAVTRSSFFILPLVFARARERINGQRHNSLARRGREGPGTPRRTRSR